MRLGDRLGIFRQRQGERPEEVQFEQSDTAQAPGIQHFPVLLNEQWLDFERELPLECPQDTAKFFAIFLFGCIVAAKMDIHTPACQLGSDRAEAPHFVGAHKDMAHTSTVFQIFQMIELSLVSVVLPTRLGPITRTMVPSRFELGPSPGEQMVWRMASRACSRFVCSMVHSFSNQATREAFGCVRSTGSNRSGPSSSCLSSSISAVASIPAEYRRRKWRAGR